MWEFLFGWVVGAVCSAPSRPLTPYQIERMRQFDAAIDQSIGSKIVMTNFPINMSGGNAVGQNAVITVKDGIAYNENWSTKG
jgi:hypothetical protein